MRPLPNPLKLLKSERGVALLIALFAFTLLSFIAIEVAYDTSVEQVVSSQQVNRVRGYYAAKAGVEISLLRIMLYKQAVAALGDSLGGSKAMLDPIWSFPLMWPPTVGDAKVTDVDKDSITSAVGESLMEGQYATTITPEGGRLDINDLGSDAKLLKQATIKQVLQIFKSELEHNEEFAKKYRGFNFDELVNNIADYVDEDSESLNGGDEGGPYRDVEDHDVSWPPNRPLRTIDELHQVAGMTDDFYKILAPRVTVYGTKGININYADKEMLMNLDPTMTEEAVNKVIERRNDPKLGGLFQGDEDFFNFIRNYGVNTRAIEESKIPLLYDIEYNFRIISTGVSANVRREITAITYDYENLVDRLADIMDKQDQKPGDQDSANPDPQKSGQGKATNAKIKSPKGRPTVVYWEEN